jgi:hypothetical protein
MIFNRSDFDAILTPSPSPFPIPIRWLPVPRCVFPFMLGSAVDGMKPLPFLSFSFSFLLSLHGAFAIVPCGFVLELLIALGVRLLPCSYRFFAICSYGRVGAEN